MSLRENLFRWRASRLGELLIRVTDVDVRWRVRNVRFPVYLQASKNLSEILTRSGKEGAERELFRSIAAHPEMKEFWDVGANIGQYTWEFISAGPNKRAILFEPDERNVATISKTIAGSSIPNCEIRKQALSDRIGVLHFKRDTITGKQGTILSDANIERVMGRPASLLEISCTTIDQVSNETGLAPDLLKIDVEGAEQAVIAGGAKTLEAQKPIMFIEILPKNFPLIERNLTSLGYALFDAASKGPAHKDSFNVVAIAPEHHQTIFDSLFARK